MRRPAIPGVVLASLLAADLGFAGVDVALTPPVLQVAPGAEFDLRIEVVQSGSAFDGYHAAVGYDSAVLDFLELPPASQEGSLMTGACGSTFHSFVASTYELDISHAIVCPGIDLLGPGELYVLRFRAVTPEEETLVFFTQIDFAESGNPVPIAGAAAALVQIGPATDARTTDGVLSRSVTMSPNPLPSGSALRIDIGRPAPEFLLVSDVRGRIVHRRTWTGDAALPHTVVWTAVDGAGSTLPSGLYFVTVGNRSRRVTTRITILD